MAAAENQCARTVKRIEHSDRARGIKRHQRRKPEKEQTEQDERDRACQARHAKLLRVFMRRCDAYGRGRSAQRNAEQCPQHDYDELRVDSGQDGENSDRNESDTRPSTIRTQAARHFPHGLRNDRNSD